MRPLRGPVAEVRLPPPALGAWREGNLLPGVWRLESGVPGPHVMISALIHGNEYAGAVVLHRWLEAGLRPRRGCLTLVFANLDAFDRFDPADPTLSRYVDQDMNRLWDRGWLDGPRHSAELRRARALRPLLEGVDVLLDLHSMLWPSDPVLLIGRAGKNRALARALGVPAVAVADDGHPDGRRLVDHGAFADPAAAPLAILAEGGPHWRPETVATLDRCARAVLRETGLLPEAPPAASSATLPAAPGALWEATHTVLATTRAFGFRRPFRGGEVIPRRDTVVALDGEREIRTPYDDCMLVMPSHYVLIGHTAVRLARRAEDAPGDPG